MSDIPGHSGIVGSHFSLGIDRCHWKSVNLCLSRLKAFGAGQLQKLNLARLAKKEGLAGWAAVTWAVDLWMRSNEPFLCQSLRHACL